MIRRVKPAQGHTLICPVVRLSNHMTSQKSVYISFQDDPAIGNC